MKRRRIGEIDPATEEVLIAGGLVVGAYLFVIRPIMGSLGLTGEDSQSLTDLANTSPGDNPFSIYFDNLQQLDTSWAQQTAAQYDADPHQVLCSYILDAEKIRGSFGWLIIDENTVRSVFSAIPSQDYVSRMAQYLYYGRGVDLWTLMENGQSWVPFSRGLYDKELADILRLVKSVPRSGAWNATGCY